MIEKIKELYNKHKEVIVYIFFGGATTLVNLLAYWIFELILGEELYLVSNFIAWVIAAIFAYFVNKIFVFTSKSWAPKVILKESLEFLGARVFSFGVEELGMLMFVDGFKFKNISFDIFSITITGQLIAKVILAVIVVILNYFFSKFIIFRKNKVNQEDKLIDEIENASLETKAKESQPSENSAKENKSPKEDNK